MKIAVTIVAVLIGLLSLAAGGAKIALVPQEVVFLSQFGFVKGHTVSFGVVQVVGGLLMLIPKTRLFGALIAAAGFALSVALLMAAGNMAFAGVSLVPVLLAGFVAYQDMSARQTRAAGGEEA